MNIKTISVGSFGVNCSILAIDGKTYVIDPGAEAERIVSEIEKLGLPPAAILLTHTHFDHIGGIAGLQKAYPDLKVLVAEADVPAFGHPMNEYPPDYPRAPRPANIVNSLSVPGMEPIATPGHTPGGVSYYFAADKLLFSGDTLFCGSVGRTDLPGGDMSMLLSSLEKLKTLPPDTVIVPGHGPKSSIAAELKYNQFLR